MLGLSTGLMYEGFIQEPPSILPLTIDDCVAWYDFTDNSTMWQDHLTANDPVASDGEEIDRIDNKAYTLQSNNTNALAAYLYGNDAVYKTGGANGNSYLKLDGTNGSLTAGLGGLGGVGDGESIGWPLSESTISLAAFTIFLVADSHYTDGRAFSIFGDKEDSNDSSRKEFHLYHDVIAGTYPDWVSTSQYKIDCYDGSTTTTITPGTTGRSDNLHIITGVLSGSGDSQLYRDGDNTDGTTSASSGSGSIDITHASPDIYEKENRIIIGRNMNWGSTSDSNTITPNWDWGFGGHGKIYEIICYNRELTSEELSTIETHLKEKYDIS